MKKCIECFEQVREMGILSNSDNHGIIIYACFNDLCNRFVLLTPVTHLEDKEKAIKS